MAFFTTTIFPTLIFLAISTQTHLCHSLTDPKFDLNRPSSPLKSTDIHDLMLLYGFPKGLLPDNIKSYTLSDDGHFEINLQGNCYVLFDLLVYYDEKIKGKLSYGYVSEVSGIQAKKLFLWVSVTGIEADEATGMLNFYVGFLSETLPAEQFQRIPTCQGERVEAI